MTYNLTIDTKTVIILSPDIKDGIFINYGESPIIIKGGEMVLKFYDNNDYKNFVDEVKRNKSYEFIVIKGKYEGEFDEFKLNY